MEPRDREHVGEREREREREIKSMRERDDEIKIRLELLKRETLKGGCRDQHFSLLISRFVCFLSVLPQAVSLVYSRAHTELRQAREDTLDALIPRPVLIPEKDSL